MWLARRNVAIALAMGLALGAPSAALAARSVPHGFFGMNWDQEVAYRSSSITRAEQWGRMAAAGVESVRTPFLWTNAQPTSAGRTSG